MKACYTLASHWNALILTFVAFFLTASVQLGYSQVTPEAGTVQCFQVGEGALFNDHGGPGGDPTVEGAPGNYSNCDCVTTTTICSTDGSALTAEITNFGIFATFDWLVILDGFNPFEEVYPYSILAEPSNVNFQLFNNADGVGDGGSENYGPGAEQGALDLFDLPTTTFTSTNPVGCLTFVFRASGVVDDPGWDAVISVASGAPHPGDGIACDIDLSCPPPSNFGVTDITFESGLVTWTPTDSTDTYIVEYGPAGFAPGTGTIVTITGDQYLIEGLEENTAYDVYILSDCGDEQSFPLGPISFTTEFINPPSTCTYTIELFDSFGDGWNGSSVEIVINGQVVEVFTLDNINDDGSFNSFTFEVLDGLPISLNYSSGIFEGEVTYFLYDSDGLLVFSDGPFPAVGQEVFVGTASCPDCPAINPGSVTVEDVFSNGADISWDPVTAAENYIIEYGPTGFPLGFGLTATSTDASTTISPLNPCVTYDFYITVFCGQDSVSTAVGPFSFTTLPETQGDPCTYTIELFDSFGDGWNGAFLTVEVGGVATDYTVPFGDGATYEITAFSNQPIIFSYSGGVFENEVTYNILDPDGNIIFSDGPFPLQGQNVFTTIACPTCAGPVSFTATDINATSAIFAWTPAQEPGSYVLEFGPLGFILGEGTSISTDATTATITGLMENTYYDAYLAFVCDDDGESAKTLGPITFKTIFLNDVGISGILSPTVDSCNLSANTLVQVVLENFGQNPQSLIPFYYAVNGVVAPIPVPTDGFYTGVIGNDSTEVIFFETTFDFSAPGYYLVEAWTELGTDNNTVNDTFSVEIITAYPLPLMEDFEDEILPEGWTHNQFNPIFAPNAHNNPTWIISSNVWSFNPLFEFTTQRVGPMGATDTLTFDYRLVNFFAGTTATTILGNTIEVQISTDCGETYETIYQIDETNHVASTDFATVVLPLESFNLEGTGINVRFVTTWASGDFWADFDNINISGCPATFVLSANIQNASGITNNDGSITVTPTFGTGPFSYVWDDDNITTGPVLDNVGAGVYTVVIEDANGCTDQATYTVLIDEPSSTIALNGFDAVTLSPNPSPGLVQLSVEMLNAEDLQIDVFDAVGHLVMSRKVGAASLINEELDLEGVASGLYFVRLSTATRLHMERLILSK